MPLAAATSSLPSHPFPPPTPPPNPPPPPQGSCSYQALLDNLFYRLPEEVGQRLAERICGFLLHRVLAGLTLEVAYLGKAAATYHPNLTLNHLIQPMILKVCEDLPDSGGPAVTLCVMRSAVGCWTPSFVEFNDK